MCLLALCEERRAPRSRPAPPAPAPARADGYACVRAMRARVWGAGLVAERASGVASNGVAGGTSPGPRPPRTTARLTCGGTARSACRTSCRPRRSCLRGWGRGRARARARAGLGLGGIGGIGGEGARWAADLPHYDVYAPRDATRCLRVRRRLRLGGVVCGTARAHAGLRGAGGVQGAHHERNLESHQDPCGGHEGEQRRDETHT
eukprot:scaffold22379_cov60-Phaeocystis_antarctica.AAC.5